MNMDACLPGHVAAEATAATEGGNTKAEEGGGGGDERERERERTTRENGRR